MRVLLPLFQYGFLLFLFLLWLLWLTKLCWIVVMSGHPCLVPDFRGNAFDFSPLKIKVCCGFIIYGFYSVEICSFYVCFLEGFYHKWKLNFVKGFLCIYWDNHMAFIFQFLMWCITLIDLNIGGSLHPCYKAHLVMMYDLLNILLDSVC